MNKLQIILIGVSILIAAVAVLIITGVIPGVLKEGEAGGTLTFWAFDDKDVYSDIIRDYTSQNRSIKINYVEKNEETFEVDFVNTLAASRAPDVVIMPSDYLFKHQNKLTAAPAILITEREIRQNFVEAASYFLTFDGRVIGMPLYADSLVLYWNRDLFTQNFITLPPKTWEEFSETAQTITRKDNFGNITVSGAALGRSINIDSAHLILTALFIQAGEKIIDEGGKVVLGDSLRSGTAVLQPAESSLRFFSDFANPTKVAQSWSAALSEAQDLFTGGRLGMYFGKVSEFNDIRDKNPHLNFGVSPVPQLSGSQRALTSGTLYAATVPLLSANYQAAWNFAKHLSSQEVSVKYADAATNVSLWRNILPSYQREDARFTFAQSALALRLWPNPDPKGVKQIFDVLIEDTALSRGVLREVINRAAARIKELAGGR